MNIEAAYANESWIISMSASPVNDKKAVKVQTHKYKNETTLNKCSSIYEIIILTNIINTAKPYGFGAAF